MVELLLIRTVREIKFRKVLDYWPYVILLIPILIIAFPLTKPGAILVQDFPFSTHALTPDKALSTWVDFGSSNNLENLVRFPEISVGLIFSAIGMTPDLISKLMVAFVFYLASVSFYIFSTRLLKNKVKFDCQLKIAAVIGSLFYAYNIWSFDRILHWHLWLGYALLPLFFISVILVFKNPRQWKYYLVAVLSWSVASSTPHMLVFFGLVFIGTASFFIITKIRDKRVLIQSTTATIIILSIFLLVNAYWIYPAILSIESNEIDLTSTFGYVVTEESTKIFSEGNNFTNVFRFTQEEVATPPSTSPLFMIWSFVGFLLPAIAFLALFSKTFFRYALVFSLLAVLGIYLVMGSNAPFDLYSILLFKLPYVSSIAEKLFRSPDRWAFLIAISYSTLISITTFEILRIVQKIRIRYRRIRFSYLVQGLFISVIVGSIVIISHPIYNYYFVDRHSPAILPNDFNELNQFIRSVNTDRVVYFPVLLYSDDVFHEVTWDNRKMLVPDIYQWSSAKPNIGHYRDVFIQNYYRYLTSLLTENKTDYFSNLVTPFGTSYIIYHNDTRKPVNSEFLQELSSLADVRNVTKIGFFNIFKTNNNNTSISIPDTNLLITGGLSRLTSLNGLPHFNSSRDSLLFLNQFADLGKDLMIDTTSSNLIITNNPLDLFLSSINKKHILVPFDATNHHNVSGLWSIAGTLDPWYGEFHPSLRDLRIENWDFDYGKGLVITQARGATLDIPFNVEATDSYDIFVRYMKNQKGGEVRVYLDNELIDSINTRDSKQNTFVWKNIGSSLNLTQGKHTLTLENVVGFNAINIFAVLPTDETARLVEKAYSIANNTRNIFLLEAESDFQSVGRSNSSHPNFLLELGKSDEEMHKVRSDKVSRFNQTTSGMLEIPMGVDYISLYFLAKNYHFTETSGSSYHLNLELTPIKSTSSSILSPGLNPETATHYSLDNALIRPSFWINENTDNQSVSAPIRKGANKSVTEDKYPLMIDIKHGNSTNWNVLSTDFIPVNDTIPYSYNLSMSARDVNLLHLKVNYFDSSKKQIKENLIFGGIDSTFNNNTFTNTLKTPPDTAYIKLQTWVLPNPRNDSYYLLDNLEVHPSPLGIWMNENKETQSVSVLTTKGGEANKSLAEGSSTLRVDIQKSNSTNWNVLSTDFIPVKEDGYYDYGLDIAAKDVNMLHWKVSYYDSQMQKVRDDTLSDAINGTFRKNLDYNILPPLGTEYLSFSFWAKHNPAKESDYTLDSIKFEEFIHENRFNNDSYQFENMNSTNQKVVMDGKDLRVELIKGDSEGFNIVRTEPIGVRENSRYNYTISVDLKNLADFKVYASRTRTDDIAENSTKYGSLASNGNILTLTPRSEIFTELDILKPSNYTLAVHTNTCKSCTPLRTSIIDDNGNNIIIADRNISLLENSDIIENNDSQLTWQYLQNIYLERGHYKVKIYSDSQRDLDSVVLYSSDSNQSETLIDIFNKSDAPAHIAEYTKVDPTKYTVNITNTTRPYFLSFSESYDPFWTAHIIDGNSSSNSETNSNSIPLYSIINGFYVDKLGDYSITIEYKPQQWFIQGAIISIATLVSIAVYFIFYNYGIPLYLINSKMKFLSRTRAK